MYAAVTSILGAGAAALPSGDRIVSTRHTTHARSTQRARRCVVEASVLLGGWICGPWACRRDRGMVGASDVGLVQVPDVLLHHVEQRRPVRCLLAPPAFLSRHVTKLPAEAPGHTLGLAASEGRWCVAMSPGSDVKLR